MGISLFELPLNVSIHQRNDLSMAMTQHRMWRGNRGVEKKYVHV